MLTASMGSGHDAVATELIRRLTAPGHQASRVDVLDLLPGGVGAGLRSFYRATIRHLPALYASLYAAFFRESPRPLFESTPLAALAGSRLRAVVSRLRPEVIVSVFHLAAQMTGRLRELGVLPVPSAVVVTDFAVHRQWLHRGNDLHLCLTPEIAAHIGHSLRRPAVTSGPLIADRFFRSRSPAEVAGWRRRLAAQGRSVVLLSTGAWGAATRLTETIRLVGSAGYLPVVLCGQNQRLRRQLSDSPHAVALDWVDDMPGLMAAARVLIDNAAGQTALQALAAGLPVVGYRPIPGHGAEGVRCMADLGLSEHVKNPDRLLGSLRVLSAPGPARERRIAAGRAISPATVSLATVSPT